MVALDLRGYEGDRTEGGQPTMSRRYDPKALADIEDRLRAEDAEFVELFRMVRAPEGGTTGWDWRCGFGTAIVLTILSGVLFVLVAEPFAAVLCCLAVAVLVAERARYRARRPPR